MCHEHRTVQGNKADDDILEKKIERILLILFHTLMPILFVFFLFLLNISQK